jgi:hypothetical protein
MSAKLQHWEAWAGNFILKKEPGWSLWGIALFIKDQGEATEL